VPSAIVSTNTSGDNSIVSAVSGYAIRVIGYVLTAANAVNVTWKSDTGGGAVALTGALQFTFTTTGSVAPLVVPESQPGGRGWFQTAPGKALNLNLSGAVQVNGHVLWELVSQ
jgi:hypothetical protein